MKNNTELWNEVMLCYMCDTDNIPETLSEQIQLKKIIYNQITDVLDLLYYCDCCCRHQINKPVIISHLNDETEPNNIVHQDCYCDCRHIARRTCRLYKKIHDK